MPEGNVEVVRGAYEAFGRQDIPGVMSIMREDVEWHVPTVVPQGMDTSGHDGVGGFFQRVGGLWEDLEVNPVDYLTTDDRVAAVIKAKGKYQGEEVSYEAVHLWTLESGKVTRFQEFVDVDRDAFGGG